MTTIEAPRIAGRDRARADVEPLALSPGTTLIVQFPPRAAATPSYVDELIAVVCGDRGAALILRGLSERAHLVARESAVRHGVLGLVTIEP